MAFATNENLVEYIADIFDQGVDDWTTELTKAEDDVVNQIKIRYWNNHRDRNAFDKSKLTESQWTKATVYKAFAAYIMPKLSTFRIDDVFVEQMKFYKQQFEEELNTQFAIGIEYDENGDGNVDNAEITEYNIQDRLYR